MDEVGNGLELWVVLATALGSALLGAIAGLLGGLALERRKETRHGRAIVASIMMEMALTCASIKAAVLLNQRRRKILRKDFWDRYGVDIVHFLPQYLVKALHLVYVDGFDIVQDAYEKGTQGPISKEIGATMLSWAYQTERLFELVQERRQLDSGWRRPILNRIRRLRSQDIGEPTFEDVLKELETYATQHLLDDGYPVEVTEP